MLTNLEGKKTTIPVGHKRGSCWRCAAVLDNPRRSTCDQCKLEQKHITNQPYNERRTSEDYKRSNSKRTSADFRRYNLKQKYSLDHDPIAFGVSCCQMCGSGDKLNIDHNHETGEVRGVLCHSCNITVGYVEKVLKLGLDKFINYIGG